MLGAAASGSGTNGTAGQVGFCMTAQASISGATRHNLIEDFRNHYRRTVVAKPSRPSGAFVAILNDTDQNDNKSNNNNSN